MERRRRRGRLAAARRLRGRRCAGSSRCARARASLRTSQQQLLREAQFKVLKYQFLKQHDLPRNQKKLFCDYLRRELEKHVEGSSTSAPPRGSPSRSCCSPSSCSTARAGRRPTTGAASAGRRWGRTPSRTARWSSSGLPWLLALLTFLFAWRANTMYHERLHHVYDEHFESFFRSHVTAERIALAARCRCGTAARCTCCTPSTAPPARPARAGARPPAGAYGTATPTCNLASVTTTNSSAAARGRRPPRRRQRHQPRVVDAADPERAQTRRRRRHARRGRRRSRASG